MKKLVRIAAILIGTIILLPVLSALSNLGLPEQSRIVESLGDLEKARISEYFHLRESLGNQVWTGWGSADIPVIVYNEEYAFLVGFQEKPAVGWTMVPSGEERGRTWQEVPEDDFFGEVYYRQPLASSGKTPENFTAQVGSQWVATLMTREYTRIRLVEDLKGELPPGLRVIVPYRLVWELLLGSTETYIGGLAHESFHALQGIAVPDKFDSAESVHFLGDQYPWDDDAFQDDWKAELDLLYQAASAESDEKARSLAVQFLEKRQQRRESFSLDRQLIDYERKREWLEGMAKYAELEIQKTAAESPAYQPLPAISEDGDFNHYQDRTRYWRRQLAEVKRTAGREGDARFYYSGFAQGVLLDRFQPDWKSELWSEDVWLEELLWRAVSASEGD